MRRLKTACSTRMSTQERWFESTRYHSRVESPSRPRVSSGNEPIRLKMALLVPIQPSARAVMPRLVQRRQAPTGTIAFSNATVKSSVHQTMTLHTISVIVTTPLIVEPLRCCTE
jgi:hypothetical protein